MFDFALLSRALALFGDDGVARWLSLAAGVIAAGGAADGRLTALNDQVRAIVEEGRAPSPAEWAAMDARSDVAHGRIQDEAQRRGGNG